MIPGVVSLSSRASYVQILKLPQDCDAVKVFDSVKKSFKCQPVQVSPLGLQMLTKFQPKNFSSYLNRLLRININADMKPADIDLILKELATAVAPYDTPVELMIRSETPVSK